MRAVQAILAAILVALPPAAVAARPGGAPVDVIIDAGHGGIDGGTSHEGVYEKHINLQIAKKVYDQLAADGFQVVLNRTGDYALSEENEWLDHPSRHRRDLAQRRGLAAALVPQTMVSLHVNWSKDSGERGALVLYQPNHQSYLLANILQHHLNQLYGEREKPVEGKQFYLLRHSICPTVIVEMGFLSNPSDRERLTRPDKQVELARAVSSGVKEYFLLVGHLQDKPHEPHWWQDILRWIREHVKPTMQEGLHAVFRRL